MFLHLSCLKGTVSGVAASTPCAACEKPVLSHFLAEDNGGVPKLQSALRGACRVINAAQIQGPAWST